MKKYFIVYWQMVLFSLKSKMEYRWNFALQMMYGPAYTFVLYLLVEIAYSKTQTLGGWTRAEGLLLFYFLHLMYALSILLFLSSIRHLLWQGIRHGEMDFHLVKPLNPQFMATVTKPEIQQIFLITSLALLLGRHVMISDLHPTPLNVLIFVALYGLGFVINYLAMSTYATLGFYVTRAQQILEVYDKVTDHGQYPTSIYPPAIQLIAFSLIPMAFFSYVPVTFLLGRGNWWLALASLVVVTVLFVINQTAWKYGLRQYSSASS